MKKYLQLLSMMLCMMAGTMFFVACGDDDDDDTNPTSSITEQDLYGGWYGIDENSSEKVNLFWIYLEPEGRGMYGEIKAKAKNNWRVEDASVDITWTLQSGTLTMLYNSQPRVGDVVKKNSDGSLQVKRHLNDGKTDVITIYPLQDQQALYQIVEQMVQEKTGNGGQTATIAEQDLYGGWYGIDENSSEKINIFWIYLEPEGRGMYGEVKAKAKHNWELEDASVDINWVLTSGVLTMSFESEEGTMYRVGEVLSKNSDGSLQVKRHLDEGETDVITIYPLQNMDNLYRMMEEMIASKK
ncbi:MAG: hypothetical protein J5486_08025 [Bacteroidaceae bacterium]|nr:hypothetical protein [Bacteroidaceae bacterium]